MNLDSPCSKCNLWGKVEVCGHLAPPAGSDPLGRLSDYFGFSIVPHPVNLACLISLPPYIFG